MIVATNTKKTTVAPIAMSTITLALGATTEILATTTLVIIILI